MEGEGVGGGEGDISGVGDITAGTIDCGGLASF